MRAICWSVLSLALLIQNPGAEGQDAPRPALPGVQAKKSEPKAIVIDEDELQSRPVVLRAGKLPSGTPEWFSANDEPAAVVLRAGKLPTGMPQSGGGLDGTIDRLIKDLEDLRRDMKKIKPGQPGFPPGGPGPQPGQPGFPQGGPGPMPGQPGFPPGASHVDQKLDMILRQMDEMRRDIKDLQSRLPPAKQKKGPPFDFKGFFWPKGPLKKPGFPPAAPPQSKESEAKPDAATQKALQYLQDRERQKAADNALLKQQIERLLEQVEKLRNEIPKANPAK